LGDINPSGTVQARRVAAGTARAGLTGPSPRAARRRV